MIDPQVLRELGEDRHKALLEVRAQQRLIASLPKQKSAVPGLTRQVVTAVIHRLESLGRPRAAAPQPCAESVSRGT